MKKQDCIQYTKMKRKLDICPPKRKIGEKRCPMHPPRIDALDEPGCKRYTTIDLFQMLYIVISMWRLVINS